MLLSLSGAHIDETYFLAGNHIRYTYILIISSLRFKSTQTDNIKAFSYNRFISKTEKKRKGEKNTTKALKGEKLFPPA